MTTTSSHRRRHARPRGTARASRPVPGPPAPVLDVRRIDEAAGVSGLGWPARPGRPLRAHGSHRAWEAWTVLGGALVGGVVGYRVGTGLGAAPRRTP